MKRVLILAGVCVMATSAHAGFMSADFGYQWLSQVSFSTTAGNFTENTARIYGTRTGGDDTILPHPNFSFDSYCVELGENISFGNYTHDVYNLLGSQTDSGAPFGAVHFDAFAELRQVTRKCDLWHPEAEVWRIHESPHIDLLLALQPADQHEQIHTLPPCLHPMFG